MSSQTFLLLLANTENLNYLGLICQKNMSQKLNFVSFHTNILVLIRQIFKKHNPMYLKLSIGNIQVNLAVKQFDCTLDLNISNL